MESQFPDVLRVKVTATDIGLGRQYHGSRCPLGRAVRRKLKLKNFSDISIGPLSGVRLCDTSLGVARYSLSQEDINWIIDFDTGRKPVEPRTFVLHKRYS